MRFYAKIFVLLNLSVKLAMISEHCVLQIGRIFFRQKHFLRDLYLLR